MMVEPVLAQMRYGGFSRHRALALLAIVLALIAYGLVLDTPKADPGRPPSTGLAANIPANDDLRLYREITRRVAEGENYYSAVATEHRFNHYPLKPFFVVRLPFLAEATALLGPIIIRALGIALVTTACLLWWRRLREGIADPGRRVIGAFLVLIGLMPLLRPSWLGLHELWAGALVVISLAAWRPGTAYIAMIVAAVALLLRETVLPFILLMGAAAMWERRWRESAGWGILIALFAIIMVLHAHAVAGVVVPSDLASPGWVRAGGWATYLQFVKETTVLRAFPLWLTAIIVPLCLFGWGSWMNRSATITLLFQGGYALIFMLIGRPDNFYWGFLVAPTLLLGLAFLPGAIPAFVTAIRKPSSQSLDLTSRPLL